MGKTMRSPRTGRKIRKTRLFSPGELTLRGILLGIFLTLIFIGANSYLGLRLGMTFATSIPAAIVSMGALKALGRSNLLENNMVQTIASAAGTLSAVCMTLPALVMAEWWKGFPYWQTALLTFAGGASGVLFTIPLRKALVTGRRDLPYPEGVACAEILRSGEGDRAKNADDLKYLAAGTLVSALGGVLTSALHLVSDGFQVAATFGSACFRLNGSFSLALIGVGYMVGLGGSIAWLSGTLLGWDVLIPIMQTLHPAADPAAQAAELWTHKIRLIGAGVIAISSLWVLFSLSGAVRRGLKQAFSAKAHANAPLTERDLSPRFLLGLLIFLGLLLTGLCLAFLSPHLKGSLLAFMAALGVIACLGTGAVTASACGYMAGLMGSSSSPISGIGLLGLLLLAGLMSLLQALGILGSAQGPLAVGYCLFILSGIIASAAVANDNLQDLKTGEILGAAPWRQEIGLLIGCLAGAAVIPPLFNLLYNAYGFTNHMPRPDMDLSQALPAPQPALMAAIARGLIAHQLDWPMLALGAAIGGACIPVHTLLKKYGTRWNLSFPPLAVGLGLYLPAGLSLTVTLGAVLAHMFRPSPTPRGTMLASGLLVGESLTGIAVALLAGLSGSGSPLAIPLTGKLASIPIFLGWTLFPLALLWIGLSLKNSPRGKADF